MLCQANLPSINHLNPRIVQFYLFPNPLNYIWQSNLPSIDHLNPSIVKFCLFPNPFNASYGNQIYRQSIIWTRESSNSAYFRAYLTNGYGNRVDHQSIIWTRELSNFAYFRTLLMLAMAIKSTVNRSFEPGNHQILLISELI